MKLSEFLNFLLGCPCRYDKCASFHSVPVPKQEITSTQRIQELETLVSSLYAQIMKLKEENRLLQEECNQNNMRIHDMEIMVSVFEKMAPKINIFHTEKADQINAVVESGANVSHTDKNQ